MRVSVIIASYNYGHVVGDALRSVQEQTVDDLEIIVVDDGSTDETTEVLAAIDEPRLRVRRIPNSGVSVARNTGLEMARGEFIAFLDADDRWRPTKLERQLAMMESEPELGLVFTNFVRFIGAEFLPHTQFDFVPDLAAVLTRPSQRGGGRVIEGDAFAHLVPLSDFPAYPSTVMVRAAQVRGVSFPPGVRLCEDLHYMLRVYSRARAGFITDPLVELRRHDSNSYSSLLEISEATLNVYRRAEAEAMSEEHRQVLRRRLGKSLTGLAYHHFHHRRPLGAASAAVRALAFPGSRLHALKRLALLPALPLLADPANASWD